MAIDILNIEPTTISRDLKGKYICIYGPAKVGKTTFASRAPRNLLLAFEKGYNGLAGVKAVDINKWSDLKLVLKQLERKEAQEMYDTVTIDTVGLMWQMCEDYICVANGVQSISDIPWGKGYSLCKKEFDSSLRKITKLGYGLIIIAHVEKRIEKIDDDNSIEIFSPNIPKRAYDIVNQLVDIIGFINVEYDKEGIGHRYLYTRSNPTFLAGSRFPHLPQKIPFGYTELSEALSKAIEQSGIEDGATIVDKDKPEEVDERTFNEVRKEAEEIWTSLIKKNPDNAKKIMELVEEVFGHQMKLSEITESQVDLFKLLVDEMKALM